MDVHDAIQVLFEGIPSILEVPADAKVQLPKEVLVSWLHVLYKRGHDEGYKNGCKDAAKIAANQITKSHWLSIGGDPERN